MAEEYVTEANLLELYRHCPRPLNMYSDTTEMIGKIKQYTDVIGRYVDDRGNSVLLSLVFHVNRGLRYHPYAVQELKRLVDNCYASKESVIEKCQEIDSLYHDEVYKCMELILSYRPDCNHVPAFCPPIPHNTGWTEMFELKIVQSESRWRLMGLGTSMETSMYRIFDPITSHRVPNKLQLCLLHLAAWRGDYKCIDLLIKHGANVNTLSSDGRNALHFLYHYCNKPCDLIQITKLLISYDIDVNAEDRSKNTPIMTLLNHVFVKRDHVRYLANSYAHSYTYSSESSKESCRKCSGCNSTSDEPQPSTSDTSGRTSTIGNFKFSAEQGPANTSLPNDYIYDIKECIKLLVAAGANLNHRNCYGEGILQILMLRLQHCVAKSDMAFQMVGHYLVPYSFKLKPLIEILQFLFSGIRLETEGGRSPVQVPFKVNDMDCSNPILPALASAVHGLCMEPPLNTTQDLITCFKQLLDNGANVNGSKLHLKTTATHIMLKNLSIHVQGLDIYMPVLEMFAQYNCDFNMLDVDGNSPLKLACAAPLPHDQQKRLLSFLLTQGADPNLANNNGKYPIEFLLERHTYHHDDLLSEQPRDVKVALFTENVKLMCLFTRVTAMHHVFRVFVEQGLFGLFCDPECSVYKMLQGYASEPSSLQHIVKLELWKLLSGVANGVESLPLPDKLKEYITDLWW